MDTEERLISSADLGRALADAINAGYANLCRQAG